MVDSEADVKAFADYKGESSEGQAAGKQEGEQKPKEASGTSKSEPKPEVKTGAQQQQKDQQQDKSKKVETKGNEKEHHSVHGKGVPRTNVRSKYILVSLKHGCV